MQQDNLASRMIGMLSWVQSDACPKLDTPKFRELLATPLTDTPPSAPREDFIVEPSGRIAALRARADMLIRNAVADLQEAAAIEETSHA
jgi:hypothetical protein